MGFTWCWEIVWQYSLELVKQAADYEITAEHLISNIKKTFSSGNHIGNALKGLKEYNICAYKPTLEFSNGTNDETKEAENEQFKIEMQSKGVQ